MSSQKPLTFGTRKSSSSRWQTATHELCFIPLVLPQSNEAKTYASDQWHEQRGKHALVRRGPIRKRRRLFAPTVILGKSIANLGSSISMAVSGEMASISTQTFGRECQHWMNPICNHTPLCRDSASIQSARIGSLLLQKVNDSLTVFILTENDWVLFVESCCEHRKCKGNVDVPQKQAEGTFLPFPPLREQVKWASFLRTSEQIHPECAVLVTIPAWQQQTYLSRSSSRNVPTSVLRTNPVFRNLPLSENRTCNSTRVKAEWSGEQRKLVPSDSVCSSVLLWQSVSFRTASSSAREVTRRLAPPVCVTAFVAKRRCCYYSYNKTTTQTGIPNSHGEAGQTVTRAEALPCKCMHSVRIGVYPEWIQLLKHCLLHAKSMPPPSKIYSQQRCLRRSMPIISDPRVFYVSHQSCSLLLESLSQTWNDMSPRVTQCRKLCMKGQCQKPTQTIQAQKKSRSVLVQFSPIVGFFQWRLIQMLVHVDSLMTCSCSSARDDVSMLKVNLLRVHLCVWLLCSCL